MYKLIQDWLLMMSLSTILQLMAHRETTHYIFRAKQGIIPDRKPISDRYLLHASLIFLFLLYFSHTQVMNSTKLWMIPLLPLTSQLPLNSLFTLTPKFTWIIRSNSDVIQRNQSGSNNGRVQSNPLPCHTQSEARRKVWHTHIWDPSGTFLYQCKS